MFNLLLFVWSDAKPRHLADDADRDGQSRPGGGRQEDQPYCQLSPTDDDSGEFRENDCKHHQTFSSSLD